MEKIVTIRLEDSDTEEEFQEILKEDLGGITEYEYVRTCEEKIRDVLNKNFRVKVKSINVKIIDGSVVMKKETRIYND